MSSTPMNRDLKKYANDGQQRLLSLITLLAGHEITGMAPADIARQQGCTPSVVTRDLANLQLAGFGEQVPETSRWRLSPQIVQIALKHMRALDAAEQRLADVRNRFSRT
ncbi:UNVERIFIED_ORG: hypothetical protein LHJ69_14290 [Shinella sp. XGS7]|jgi:DNA-binding IclR family transcriptional regulator|nr:hypothetical protein [Shinella sp. XGS7]